MPRSMGPEPKTDLRFGHNMSPDVSWAWLLDHWRMMPSRARTGALLAHDLTFGGPPRLEGFTLPDFVWENAESAVETRNGFNRAARPTSESSSHTRGQSTCFYVLPVPLASGSAKDESNDFEIFEWIDTRGVTCLTSHQLAPDVLKSHSLSLTDMRVITDGLMEVYLPIFDGESFMIWRPDVAAAETTFA